MTVNDATASRGLAWALTAKVENAKAARALNKREGFMGLLFVGE